MALPVSASRFAVLPDDFLDDKVKKIRKPKKDADTSFAFLNESNKKGGNKAKKPASEADKLRQDAFASGSGKKKNKKRNKANSSSSDSKSQHELSPPPPAIPPQPDSQQFQEWKQSDTKAVEDTFEKDIEKALMLSMIEAEHDREVAKEREQAKVAAAAASRKTMSLEEFNRLMEPVPAAPVAVPAAHPGQPVPGRAAAPSTILEQKQLAEQQRDFFNNVDQGAKKIVNREKIRDQIQKMHLEMAAQKERETADRVTADGVRRDAEFARLTSENDSLRAELTKVKGRYKTMRGLLEEAEVKSKAELAAEVVKLRSVNDEVMSEVDRLTQELEQSRTRVRDLENTVKLLMEKRPKPTTS